MIRIYYLQKSTARGEEWARTDIVPSSADEDEIVQLKFWSEHMDLVKTVSIGDVLIAYSMETSEYRDKFELTSMDQTVTEVIDGMVWYTRV